MIGMRRKITELLGEVRRSRACGPGPECAEQAGESRVAEAEGRHMLENDRVRQERRLKREIPLHLAATGKIRVTYNNGEACPAGEDAVAYIVDCTTFSFLIGRLPIVTCIQIAAKVVASCLRSISDFAVFSASDWRQAWATASLSPVRTFPY